MMNMNINQFVILFFACFDSPVKSDLFILHINLKFMFCSFVSVFKWAAFCLTLPFLSWSIKFFLVYMEDTCVSKSIQKHNDILMNVTKMKQKKKLAKQNPKAKNASMRQIKPYEFGRYRNHTHSHQWHTRDSTSLPSETDVFVAVS